MRLPKLSVLGINHQNLIRVLVVATTVGAAFSSYVYAASVQKEYNGTKCPRVHIAVQWARASHFVVSGPIVVAFGAAVVAGCAWKSSCFGSIVRACAEDGCMRATVAKAVEWATGAVLLSWAASIISAVVVKGASRECTNSGGNNSAFVLIFLFLGAAAAIAGSKSVSCGRTTPSVTVLNEAKEQLYIFDPEEEQPDPYAADTEDNIASSTPLSSSANESVETVM